MIGAAVPLNAATVFVGGGGNQSIGNAANWTNGLPDLTNPGTIGNAHVTTYNGTGGDLNSLELTLEMQAEMSGGTTRITDSLLFLKDDAIWEASDNVILGRNAGSSMTAVEIEGAAQLNITSGDLRVGRNQRASVSQSGGTVSIARDLGLGIANGGAFSSYEISGGQLTTGRNVVVRRSSTFSVSGGDVDIGRNLNVRDDGSQAVISGGTTRIGRNLFLRDNNTSYTQTGGEVIVDRNVQLNNTGGSRQFNLQGGILRVANRINVSANNVFVWETGGVLAVHIGNDIIDYRGDLTAGIGAVLDLDSPVQYLDVSGTLVIQDLEIKGYDLMLMTEANPDGMTVETGCYLLVEAGTLTVASVSYSVFTDSVGMLINQGDPFDPQTQTVYWHEMAGNELRVCWSVAPIPEVSPSTLIILGLSLLVWTRKNHAL